MIECEPFNTSGLMRITAETPNGHAVFTRKVPGEKAITMRGGEFDVVTGGALLDDTEAPFGTDVLYRLTLTPDDRLIQRNHVPTPRFTHGLQGWAAGLSRTASVVADPTAHTTGAVGQFSGRGGTLAAPPTFVGSVNTSGYVTGSYTLFPPTTGGTAIAANDVAFLVHTQLASDPNPDDPVGWTLIRTFLDGSRIRVVVWRRVWLNTDNGSGPLVNSSGTLKQGTLFWVRGAGNAYPAYFGPTSGAGQITGNTAFIGAVSAYNPALIVTVSAAETSTSGTLPTSTTGATWRYTLGTNPNTRSVVIASQSNTLAGTSAPSSVTYASPPAYLVGFQMAILNATSSAGRIFARGKLTALDASPDPYLLTGRARFSSTDVWTWNDVKLQGTWQNLKNTKATWAAVKSSTVLGQGENYSQLWVGIVDPEGTWYIHPQQVRGLSDSSANQWLDFSMYFTTLTGIPSTAEIWFFHGASIREYLANWYLDEIGVTDPQALLTRDPLYFFDGDTPVPATPQNNRAGETGWIDSTGDARIGWEGDVGNSRSYFNSPRTIAAETTCVLEPDPDERNGLCEPVLLSDPVSLTLSVWCSLISIDKITHPSMSQIYDIIGRSDAVAVSQVRGWEVGTLNLKTDTLQEREQFLGVMRSGRVILIRNPDPAYPENNWYVSIGQISEDRTLTDHRQPLRSWQVPFVRVARPAGLIEGSTLQTWAGLKALGTWDYVRTTYVDWLDVATTVTTP